MAHKEDDIGGLCPVFEAIGVCNDGWRCRWLSGQIRKPRKAKKEAWMARSCLFLFHDSQLSLALFELAEH